MHMISNSYSNNDLGYVLYILYNMFIVYSTQMYIVRAYTVKM